MAAAASHDLLLPRAPGGMLPGAAMALLAHTAMFFALTTVVQWRASAPEIVSAELWSAVPQTAAPPPPPAVTPPVAVVPPTPVPPAPPTRVEPSAPDPQIAIAQARAEREKADRAEKDRVRKEREAEAERKAQAEAKKREQLAREKQAEEQRLAEQRKKNLERMMGQAGVAGGVPGGVPGGVVGSTAALSSAPSASYSGRLVAAIKPNIVFTDTIRGNPAAEVEVRAGPSGTILARRLVRSSGDKDWDEAVLRAIDRTGSLPRDVDGRVPPVLTMIFRPQE